jgi:hypothetical protein
MESSKEKRDQSGLRILRLWARVSGGGDHGGGGSVLLTRLGWVFHDDDGDSTISFDVHHGVLEYVFVPAAQDHADTRVVACGDSHGSGDIAADERAVVHLQDHFSDQARGIPLDGLSDCQLCVYVLVLDPSCPHAEPCGIRVTCWGS